MRKKIVLLTCVGKILMQKLTNMNSVKMWL